MAEFIFFYADKPERGTIIGRENSLGRRLLHDDFVNDEGNPTDGKSGRLTFSDTDEPTQSAEAIRLNELTTDLLNGEILSVVELNEYLKLGLGGSI